MSARSRVTPWWGPRVPRGAYKAPPPELLEVLLAPADNGYWSAYAEWERRGWGLVAASILPPEMFRTQPDNFEHAVLSHGFRWKGPT